VLTIGIDLGGTFTDGYFNLDGRAFTRKVPTYRFDLTRSVVECLRAGAEATDRSLRALLERVDLLRIATTVGTNSVIEGTGSRVGLLVLAGEEERLYGGERPQALFERFVPARLVRGLPAAPEPDAVLDTARELVSAGVRQVVVSGSGVGAARAWESAIHGLLRDRYPSHYLRSVPLQLGTDVAPCSDDDVRTATSVVNAYLHRDVAQLLHGAEQHLRNEGLECPLLVVHANSGVARTGKTTAIHTYSSGPAAGLSAAETIAAAYGDRSVVTADMGGTTVDFGVIAGARAEVETRPSVAGVSVALPMLRTESIGCAGCSLVAVGDGGDLEIGPESAGAVPGPAAFGLGGERPTLTDADVVTGLLADGKDVGGQFTLSRGRAAAALSEHVAAPLGIAPEQAAARVEQAAAAVVADALADLIARKGLRADEVTVYAFGGAGPTHLWAAASRAGVRRVRSFSFGSAFSALGCTVVDLRHRYEHAWEGPPPSAGTLAGMIDRLAAKGLADIRSARVATTGLSLALQVVGGGGAALAATEGAWDPAERAGEAFAPLLAAALAPDADVRGLVLEITARIPRDERPAPESASGALAVADVRTVWWDGSPTATPVLRWADAPQGRPIAGPVIIEELDCTHAIGPGWQVTLDALGGALWEAV
jgi:N-methylhydantoinase A